jgi:sarcosine oxidase subunit beta
VIDELSASGQGQNKAAIGGVRATHSDPAKITLCRRSLDIFSHWKEATGTDIGWKMGGYCFPAFTEKVESTVKGLLPIQQKFHLNIDWLDAEALQKLVPGINPNELRGGTYSPEDGQVSPLLAAESFTREAERLGAQYRYREPVKSLVMRGNTVVGVRTEKEEYRAETVVNASGVNATAISKMAGLDVPILPDSHEGGISAPVKPFLDPLIVDLRPGPEGKTINFYFGQDANGQIIFCYTPITPISGTNRNSTYEFMPIVAARLVEVIPRLKNLTIRRVWRGLYPMTPDGSPIVGKPPNVEGFVLGVGMCGQGFMLGPGVGESLAALVAHGAPAIDREVFDLLSPARDLYKGKKEALK